MQEHAAERRHVALCIRQWLDFQMETSLLPEQNPFRDWAAPTDNC